MTSKAVKQDMRLKTTGFFLTECRNMRGELDIEVMEGRGNLRNETRPAGEKIDRGGGE